MAKKAPVEDETVKRILERYEKLKEKKRPYISEFEMVSEYVNNRQQSFENLCEPGDFCTGKVFDGCAGDAAAALVASMIGALYPSGGGSVQIQPSRFVSKTIQARKDVKDWYAHATVEIQSALDSFEAGFNVAFNECIDDEVVYGIGGISALPNPRYKQELETPFFFEVINAKKAVIDENARGQVDTVYVEKEYTIRQLFQAFDEDEIHDERKKQKSEGQINEKVRILHAVEPRMTALHGEGNDNYPIASVHIDIQHKYKMKSSGFRRMPLFVARWDKKSGEVWGRSPAMKAIADILEINTFREASIIGTEKLLDPPVIVNEDGAMSGGEIDTSSGAVNVRHMSGRIESNRPAIEPINLVGELNSTYKRIDVLTELIQNKFYSDKLTDLNNNNRMTLGEANIRNQLRGQALSLVFSRQRSELFVPLINYMFEHLLNLGVFGYAADDERYEPYLAACELEGIEPLPPIPEELNKLLDQGDIFKVVFTCEAERIVQLQALQGIKAVLSSAMELAGVAPDMLDNIDFDEALRLIMRLTGAPQEILRAVEDVLKMREAKANAMDAQQAAAQDAQGAEVALTKAKTAKEAVKAGIPLQAVMQMAQPQQPMQPQPAPAGGFLNSL